MTVHYIDGSNESFNVNSLHVKMDKELNALRFVCNGKQIVMPLYTVKKIVDF